MGDEWHEHTFADLIKSRVLEIGDGYRAKNSELGGDGPMFLRAGHVRDTHIDFEGVERFRRDLTAAVSQKMSRPGDVIVTTKGNSTGRVTYAHPSLPKFVYSPHLSFWRSLDSKRIASRFLYYWSRSGEFHEQLSGLAASTDMALYLSLVDQRRLKITLPPAATQRAIAHILGALDDKIELNRRMNETLEAMARALFKSWFVELSSERATINELARDGVLEIGDGYRAKNSELGRPGLPFIRAGDLNNGFDTTGAEVLCENSVAKAGNKICRPGDVAFTSKGTIGRLARVSEFTGAFVYSPQVCFWRSLDWNRLHPIVLYCWMLSEDLRSQIASVSGQTDMAPYVSLRDQRQMEMPIFPASQQAIAEKIEPLLKRQALLTIEGRTLATLRDTLLPKLISGELRLKDAERIVEQVA